MREFTTEELRQFDGVGGSPAYVAFKSFVYDVTESAVWGDGDHEGIHSAGMDLTEAHGDAPHDEHILDFPRVGKLA